MAPTFPQLSASLAPASPWIDLITLDASEIGGEVYHFTPGPGPGGGAVVFNGVTYTPAPIKFDGLEYNGQAQLPTPQLSVSNVQGTAMAILIANNQLLGATVTYIQTFACYLDGAEYADTSAYTEPAVFRVDRMAHADKNYVALDLAAITDQEGRKLPFRLVLQNCCTHTYRTYNAGAESFVQGTCPYDGGNYFTAFTVATEDPRLDQCGRRLRDCVARFGQNTPLPTRAFPGVALGASA